MHHHIFPPSFLTVRNIVLCISAAFLLLSWSSARADENLLVNAGLEQDDDSWKLFVPAESEGKGCEFTISTESPHSGNSCGKLSSDDFARFSAGDMGFQGVAPHPGDRCRLTFWIRSSEDAESRGTPALVVRMQMLDIDGQALPGAPALFIGTDGATSVQKQEGGVNFSEFKDPLPGKWKKVVSVFDVPDEMEQGKLSSPQFFAYYTKGAIYLDDVSLERVGNDVPLSPSTKKL